MRKHKFSNIQCTVELDNKIRDGVKTRSQKSVKVIEIGTYKMFSIIEDNSKVDMKTLTIKENKKSISFTYEEFKNLIEIGNSMLKDKLLQNRNEEYYD